MMIPNSAVGGGRIVVRHFLGVLSSSSSSNTNVFDPLRQSSASMVILKQSNEELSKEELALKEAIIRYQQQVQQQEQEQQQNDIDTDIDMDDMDQALVVVVLEELQQAYMDLEYWKEALDIEEWKCCNILQVGTEEYADSIHAQGKFHLRQYNFSKSKELYNQALEYFSKNDNNDDDDAQYNYNPNHHQRGHVLISLAGWYYFQDQLDVAMDHLQQAEPLLDSNPTLLVKCLDNQGLVYRLWGDYHSALDKYQQALQVVDDNDSKDNNDNDNDIQQALMLHVGDMYLALEEPERALEVFQELVKSSSSSSSSSSSDKGIQGVVWHNIATIHVDQGEYDLAVDEFHTALELKQETGGENHPEVAKTLNSLGILHAGALHQYPKARECFQRALMIARINAEDPSTDSDVIHILQNISHIDQQLNK